MRAGRLLTLAAADAAVLVLARPDLSRLVAEVREPSRWVAQVGADRAAAALAAAALWCVAAWVALGLVACLAAALPGAGGRIADRLARGVLPAAVYRLAAGAAGFGVLLAPAAAGATPAAAAPAAAAPYSAPAASTPAPGWPSDTPLPAPAWPTTATSSPDRAAAPAGGLASRPPMPRAPAAAPRTTQPTSRPSDDPQARSVVVRPGDSLWAIAAAHLPRGSELGAVARAWPRWFGANRAVIGDDPSLIRPGQVLAVPTSQEHRP